MKKNIDTKSVGKTMGDAFIGAALDVAAGIALAPELGKKFYNDVKKKSAEFHTSLVAQSNKVKEAVGKEVARARKHIKNARLT